MPPFSLDKFKHSGLHSGGKAGPLVTDRKQAVAILLSERTKDAKGGKPSFKGKPKPSSDSPALKGLKGAKVKKDPIDDADAAGSGKPF